MHHYNYNGLHKYIQALFAVELIAHAEDKFQRHLETFFTGNTGFKIFDKRVDKFAFIYFPDKTAITFLGTHNIQGWISDAIAFPNTLGFHTSIYRDIVRGFVPEINDDAIPKDKPVLLAGHSKGDPGATFANYCLRKRKYPDVESICFSGPEYATDRGIETLKNYGVRNTHIETDPYSEHIPSDPTDDIGTPGGRHYGYIEKLTGSGGPFDHSYENIHKNMTMLFIDWYDKAEDMPTKRMYLYNILALNYAYRKRLPLK